MITDLICCNGCRGREGRPNFTTRRYFVHIINLSDLAFTAFREENFDGSKYTSQLLKSNTINESITSLTRELNEVNNQLNVQVTSQHTQLLKQVTNLKDLENILAIVQDGVNNLQNSVSRY